MKDGVLVVITARDAAATLPHVLEALKRLRGVARAALHDDGSRDATTELAEGAGLATVRLPRSGGPSRGRNLALDRAEERFVLLLDADAVPRPAALEELLAAARRAGAAATLPRVVLDDGALQHGPARMSWFGLPHFRGWWGTAAPFAESAGYSAGGGTAILVDRGRLPPGTRFDEAFGYRPEDGGALFRLLGERAPRPELEDSDFLLRVALAGGTVAFAPRAEVAHLNSGLARQRAGTSYPAAKMALQSRNRRLLVLKTFSTASLLLGAPLQLLAETALAALAAREGLLAAYMAGWAATWAALPHAWRERRLIQAARRCPDRRLFTACLPSRRPLPA